MSGIALRADGLSKRYQIGAAQQPYRTLRDTLVDAAKAPFRAFRRSGRERDAERTIWALKDVSFEIGQGEIVGVIGRNGAGKSTLLKILSRITEPSTGSAHLYGRVGSLLEVGTGFHGELTGRENIYLNGAILGMRRAEIDRQFDRIVEFAEVEKFINTAVKHYSTGMYLRLAFAVAAHLDPEILLVDEVLAVGDAAFQRKCIGRIGEVAQAGRTVLFVSHNMGAVRSLCEKGLVLDGGTVSYFGPISKSIEAYYKQTAAAAERDVSKGEPTQTGFSSIKIPGTEGTIEQGQDFEVHTTLQIAAEVIGFTLLCLLEDSNQRGVFHLRVDSTDLKSAGGGQWKGNYAVRLKIPGLWLEPGIYSLYFKVLFQGSMARARYVSDYYSLDVNGTTSNSNALLAPKADWSVQAQQEVPVS
jgi:lipopolysaccharide transport system ATP-binding protein